MTVYSPNEADAVKIVARRLGRKARRWSVDVPDEWYVTDENDGESFIGGLYHDRLRAKIQNAQFALLTSAIGLVGGILGIAAFAKSCSH